MKMLEDIARDILDATRSGEIPALEELHRELQDLSGADTPTIDGLILLTKGSIARLVGEIPEAMSMYTRSLDLFAVHNERHLIAEVHSQLGMLHVRIGDPDLAHRDLTRALDLFQQINDRAAVARILINIGIVHQRFQDPSSAMEQFQQAIRINQEIGNEDGVIAALFNIGSVYQFIGDYPAALSNFHRCLSHHEQRGVSRAIADSLNNIAIVHYNMDEFATALDYFERALEIHRVNGRYNSVAYIIMNIGNCHAALRDNSAAMESYQAALELMLKTGEDHGGVGVRLQIINHLGIEGRFEEADAALRELESMHIPNKASQAVILRYRSRLQGIITGNLSAAREICLDALTIASTTSNRREEIACHKQLRDIALEMQDIAAYVEHNDAYIRIKEEISGKDTATKLAMQTKQREIDMREREHEKQMAVLHSTLPKHIADRVARGEQVNDHYESAAVIFVDIVGFTALSEQLSSNEVIQLLESIFTAFDDVCKRHDVVKIKTIGDSYMAVAFPHESSSSEQRAASAALDMLHEVSHVISPLGSPIQIRIGMHCGALMAGVIGTQRLQYDVWGDTVNVASRMESTGEPGRIHVSEAFANALGLRLPEQRLPELRQGDTDVIPNEVRNEVRNEGSITSSPFPIPYSLLERGAIEIKGKGTMTTYWLDAP